MESVVGIIELRRNAKPALGHEVWWLTLDKTAFRLSSWLRQQMGREAPDTPALVLTTFRSCFDWGRYVETLILTKYAVFH